MTPKVTTAGGTAIPSSTRQVGYLQGSSRTIHTSKCVDPEPTSPDLGGGAPGLKEGPSPAKGSGNSPASALSSRGAAKK